MSDNLYHSMEERVNNFRLFYRRENKRPLFGFFVGSEYPLFLYNASRSLPTGRPLRPDDFVVEDYLDDCDRLFNEHEACGGDFIWAGSAFWGIPWLEAALGCPIYANHTTGSIHSEKPPNFQETDSLPDFDENSPWIKKTKEFIVSIAERSAGRWPIGTTRMRGIADLLSALYGGENFIFAMMENGHQIKELCQKLTDFWIEYGKFQLEHIPLFHGGVGSFCYNMWAPEGTIWHQEDATALLSPALYNEFIRPYDQQIVEAFPACIIHQHSVGYIPVDAYIKMGMTALEMHIDEGGPNAQELFPTHQKVVAEKPFLIWGNLSEKDLEWIFTELPPQGLAIQKLVTGQDEAHRLYRQYIS